MSLIIPDIVIVDTLNAALSVIRNNYNDAIDDGQEERSLLYILLNDVAIGKYQYYANAKELLITSPTDPKHLDVKLAYSHNSSDPTVSVYVALASDNNKNDAIGIGEGNQEELLYTNDVGQDEYAKQYNRRFATTYQVIIVGENKSQVSVLYNVLRALIIACTNHFELSGLSNLRIGGQDIRLQTAAPDRLFSRAITLNFEYEVTTPEIFIRSVFTKIDLYYKPEGADTAQGPIQVQEDESDSV